MPTIKALKGEGGGEVTTLFSSKLIRFVQPLQNGGFFCFKNSISQCQSESYTSAAKSETLQHVLATSSACCPAQPFGSRQRHASSDHIR
mmetsp:Transcript_66736/g.97625  ORF Transcript_66736/g.97625 Transcript_66736/m.97625 type:complete len:89 (-) Transcript_66736:2160-2426(-)